VARRECVCEASNRLREVWRALGAPCAACKDLRRPFAHVAIYKLGAIAVPLAPGVRGRRGVEAPFECVRCSRSGDNRDSLARVAISERLTGA